MTVPTLQSTASIVSEYITNNSIPLHVRALYAQAQQLIREEAMSSLHPGAIVELGGSQGKGTDIVGSDADFIVVLPASFEITKPMRHRFLLTLKGVFKGDVKEKEVNDGMSESKTK
ncbi:hypothetical protein HDV00_002793 [Rhizophlyctis rosea]|nr:hypothetical protein HDV00_002793 [Rhizophlyctis rosea]